MKGREVQGLALAKSAYRGLDSPYDVAIRTAERAAEDSLRARSAIVGILSAVGGEGLAVDEIIYSVAREQDIDMDLVQGALSNLLHAGRVTIATSDRLSLSERGLVD